MTFFFAFLHFFVIERLLSGGKTKFFVKVFFSQNVSVLFVICLIYSILSWLDFIVQVLHSPRKVNVVTQSCKYLFPCPSVDLISPNQQVEKGIYSKYFNY